MMKTRVGMMLEKWRKKIQNKNNDQVTWKSCSRFSFFFSVIEREPIHHYMQQN